MKIYILQGGCSYEGYGNIAGFKTQDSLSKAFIKAESLQSLYRAAQDKYLTSNFVEGNELHDKLIAVENRLTRDFHKRFSLSDDLSTDIIELSS